MSAIKHKEKGKAKTNQSSSTDKVRQAGRLAFDKGNYAQAIAEWSKIETLMPTQLAEAYLRYAVSPKTGATQRIGALAAGLQIAPKDYRFPFHMGRALHSANRLEEAIVAYDEAERLGCPNSGLAFAKELAAIELNPEQTTTSPTLSPLSAVLSGIPVADAAPSVWQGLAQLAADNYAEAEKWLKLSLPMQKNSTSAIVASSIAASLAKQGKLDEAIDILTEMGVRNTMKRTLLWNQVVEGNNKKATEAALALLGDEKTPDTQKAQIKKEMAHRLSKAAVQYAEKGEWLAAYSASAQFNGKSIEEAHNIALCLEKSEQAGADKAWKAYLNMIAEGEPLPGETTLLRKIARVHWADSAIEVGSSQPIIGELSALLKANPDDQEARLELAKAYFSEVMDEQALEHVNRVIQANPFNEEALSLKFEISEYCDVPLSELEQAVRTMRTKKPNDRATSVQLANILAEMAVEEDDATKREAYVTEALTLHPSGIEVLRQAVFFYASENKMKQAKGFWDVLAADKSTESQLMAASLATKYFGVNEAWTIAESLLDKGELAEMGNRVLLVPLLVACIKENAKTILEQVTHRANLYASPGLYSYVILDLLESHSSLAFKWAQIGIEKMPQDTQVWYAMAHCWAAQDNTSEVRKCLDTAIKVGRNSTDPEVQALVSDLRANLN